MLSLVKIKEAYINLQTDSGWDFSCGAQEKSGLPI